VTSPPFRFAISASFTAEPIQPTIEFWGRRLSAEFEVSFAPYNQPLQTLLDPSSVFGTNQHGLNVLLVRLEDLGEPRRIETNTDELVQTVRDRAAGFNVPVLLCVPPASPEFVADPVRARAVRQACLRMSQGLAEVPGVQLLDAEQVDRLYPVENRHDPDGERLGRIPYTEIYFCALGTAIVRHAHALFTAPYKVIALDCDNTLWQGICGEDGPAGIVLDAPRRELQKFMLEQREAGMLLVLNSKNNEQDVLDTFAANPEMPLALRHFVSWRLNWESKAENLVALAAELNLGLDSFLFVDDNAKECAEVAEGVPEVLTLPLPEDSVEIPEFLRHVWAFDHPVVTEEDRQRSAYYSQAQEFGREIRRAANLEEFVAGLKLQVTFSPVTSARYGRVAQLTQRTNQFNFTTIRRTESELQALNGYEVVTMDVADRFGSYGLTGVLIFRAAGGTLEIDTFLLSCRVLGRGVEHLMLAWLGEQALARGLDTVEARLSITSKNAPARQFLHAVGAEVETGVNGGFEYRFDARRLSKLEWTRATSAEAPRRATKPRPPSVRRCVDFAAIANTLATPARIIEAMRREALGDQATAGRHGMTDVERRLAGIWSDLLKRPSIEVSDNFFEAGGHSLLAVLLILRVREEFGVELPVDDVYSATLTLGELARKIEAYRSGENGAGEYDALLAEIESLSDEEVRALLAKEEDQ
jgi:FkbH-like protein